MVCIHLSLPGCATTDRPRDTELSIDREEAAAVLSPNTTPATRPAWTVVIVVFRGANHEQLAQLGLEKVVGETSLDDVRIERRGETASAVVYGRFDSPEDPEAQRALRRVREARTADGATPFAAAVLAPPRADASAATSPMDLRTARDQFGPDALFTLQVAVYGPERGGQLSAREQDRVRRSAEQAARSLRSEGETAFFYHGPNRSMVTVGVFGSDDHDPQGVMPESAALKDARDRHPHHLVNGAARRVSVRGSDGSMSEARLEPAFLVAIPTK
ncbi:MAG: hypothetical protein AAGG07_07730 [Planctomycetota bacterium]